MLLKIKHKIYNTLRFFTVLFCPLFFTGCTDKFWDGVGEALIKMQAAYVAIADLVISIAYLSGALFVVKGIFAFKQYGEQRTMMSSQTSIRVPLTYFCVGLGMLFMPRMISLFSNSIFAQPSISIIGFQGNIDTEANVKNAIYALVQIVGLISVLRAFFLASNPHPNAGQGGISKAVIHFIAGICALNVTFMMQLLENYV